MSLDREYLRLAREVARLPLWAPRAGVPIQLALCWPEVQVNGGRFVIADLVGVLDPLDLLVMTRLCQAYLERRPRDRRLPVTLSDIARWTGRDGVVGGKDRRVALQRLIRLNGVSLTSTVRGRDGDRSIEGWHLVDAFSMPPARGRVGVVSLSETVARMLDEDAVVLLDAEVLEGLMRSNPLAGRLWVWLEAETLEQPRSYNVFAGPEGEPARERRTPAIADLLRLTERRRSRVRGTIRVACRAIVDADPEYRLEVEPTKRTMALLHAHRPRRPS